MQRPLDPKEFGLRAPSTIEQLDQNRIALVINRKSRIIMADGKKILEKLKKIQRARPGAEVFLKTTAPICSKTTLFLKEHGITILPGSLR